MDKETLRIIRQLVENNDLQKALELLGKSAEDQKALGYNQEILANVSALNQLERDNRNGLLSMEEMGRLKARIRVFILEMADKLSQPIPESGKKATSETNSAPSAGSSQKQALIFAAGFVLLILLSVLFVPCPTNAQFIVFRIALAIGVAGLAAVLPGLLQLNLSKNLAFGIALVVFALVYFQNPATEISKNSCEDTFEYSIILVSDSERLNFDTKYKGKVKLQLKNDFREATLDLNGSADFKGLAPAFQDQQVDAILDFQGWQFAETHSKKMSVKLSGKNINLKVEPDQSLSKIMGVVKDINNNFIADAVVWLPGGNKVKTDSLGYFELPIAEGKQREKQTISIVKQGFKTIDREVQPALGEVIQFVLYK
ncbi:MAG: hypothetical protein R3A50_09535 [Saprospiraceae bacterium]